MAAMQLDGVHVVQTCCVYSFQRASLRGACRVMFDLSKVVQGRREVFDAMLVLAYRPKQSSGQAIAVLLEVSVAM